MLKLQSKYINTIKAILLVMTVTTAIQLITVLPWWFFTLALILAGFMTQRSRWQIGSFFLVGFVGGFMVWFVGNLLFDQLFNGIILHKLGLLLGLPKIAIIAMSGMIGGLLSGLAFYSGATILKIKILDPLK